MSKYQPIRLLISLLRRAAHNKVWFDFDPPWQLPFSSLTAPLYFVLSFIYSVVLASCVLFFHRLTFQSSLRLPFKSFWSSSRIRPHKVKTFVEWHLPTRFQVWITISAKNKKFALSDIHFIIVVHRGVHLSTFFSLHFDSCTVVFFLCSVCHHFLSLVLIVLLLEFG